MKKRSKKQLANNTFDYVIHAAGATKCINKDDFFKVNTEGTKNLVNALIALKMPLKRFIFISSLSVYGPVHDNNPYKEICEQMFLSPIRRMLKANLPLKSISTQ